jgi:uncharacterized SAM-binding protein YcdF (DUF218 family)
MPPMIADWLTSSGPGALKPVLSALLLPPTPLLALALAGAWVTRTRPRTGRWLVTLGCVGVWLSCCTGAARWVERVALTEPAPLDAAQREGLRARAAAGEPLAIVVLGGGMNGNAPEYGQYNLNSASLGRLRYALWLARQTGVPVAASGGRGWATTDPAAPAEATRMAEIALAEWNLPLRWVDPASRDTHENAANTLALLRPAGIRELVVVTHGLHMPRALREFNAAAAASASASGPMRITPATMGQASASTSALLDWLPSGEGALRMHEVLHEVLAAIGDRR